MPGISYFIYYVICIIEKKHVWQIFSQHLIFVTLCFIFNYSLFKIFICKQFYCCLSKVGMNKYQKCDVPFFLLKIYEFMDLILTFFFWKWAFNLFFVDNMLSKHTIFKYWKHFCRKPSSCFVYRYLARKSTWRK